MEKGRAPVPASNPKREYMTSRRAIEILGVSLAVTGLALALIGVGRPIAQFRFVGGALLAAGGFLIWLPRIRRHAMDADADADAQPPDRPVGRFTFSVFDNPVSRAMNGHPGRQMAWFLFFAAVAITVGIVAEINYQQNDSNLVGGIVFILFGVGGLLLAYRAYLYWRYPKPPGNDDTP